MCDILDLELRMGPRALPLLKACRATAVQSVGRQVQQLEAGGKQQQGRAIGLLHGAVLESLQSLGALSDIEMELEV